MAELGALSLRIEADSGQAILEKLREIDDAAKITGTTVDQAAAALKSLGIAAKVAGGNLVVAETEVGRATSIVRQLGSEAKVTAGEVDRLAGKVGKLAAPKPFLGPGLPTATTESARRDSAVALVRSEAAAEQAISRRIQLLAQSARLEATRADGIRSLIGIETGLTSALARGNLTQEQRIRLNVLLARTQAAVASGTENVAGAQAAKVAIDQRAIAAAEREAYAMDRQRTAAAKMPRTIRSGAAAMAALSIAAVTGSGSLAGMATQAGLVGSVMAAEFAPVKWAGYAAGIGAVIIGVTALIGIMAKLRTEARKPREAILSQIEATKLTELAQGRADQRREELDALNKFILDAKKPAARTPGDLGLGSSLAEAQAQFRGPGALPRSLGEAENRQKQLEAEVAAANKKLAELTSEATIEGAEVAKDAIITAAESTRAVRLSELAKEQAASSAAFAAGTQSLEADYEKRRKAILEQERLERDVLEKTRAQKLKPVAGETAEAAQGRRIDAGAIEAEITALASETQARLTALDAQRAADEKALAAKVLSYQVQLEAFADDVFARRIQQINAEDAERRKVLAQRGQASAAELAALDALAQKQKDALFLQKAQADLARLRTSLETELAKIENQRLAGLLTAEQASRAIADIQQSAGPALKEAADRAIHWAEKLGDQGVLGILRQIRGELETPISLNIDITTDLITKRLNEIVEEIQAAVNAGALSEAKGRELIRNAGLGAGIASGISEAIAQGAVAGVQGKDPLKALGASLSSSLGSMLIQVGADWLKASALMKSLQLAFAANPVAAIVAAGALIAFGSAIGGSGGGASGGRTATSPVTPINIQRVITDPNAGVRQRLASAGSLRAPAEPRPGPSFGRPLVVGSPEGQRVLTSTVGAGSRRGIG